MTKKKLNYEQHLQVANRVLPIQEELLSIIALLQKQLPWEHKAVRALKACQRGLGKAIFKLDDEVCRIKHLTDEQAIGVYYPVAKKP